MFRQQTEIKEKTNSPSVCRKCNFENESGALFCNQCGEKLEAQTQCDNCKALNTFGAKFCKSCGHLLISNASTGNPEVKSEKTGSDISSTGWQPGSGLESVSTAGIPENKLTSEVQSSPGQVSPRSVSRLKKFFLNPPLIVFSILVFFYTLLVFSVRRPRWLWRIMKEPWLFVVLLVGWAFFAFLCWLWHVKRKRSQTVRQGSQMLQGEVRGFQERGERTGSGMDYTIWTFRLERYQEGRRLPPIPVEMRGRKFTGFINEGDTVKLLDKGWNGGMHSTKQVFNVTNGMKVGTKKQGYKVWIGLFIVILFFIAVAAFIFNR
ncbi:MAG: zinc ribbon domain-containing protein [Candidatus Aminicenantes bacterium]|jgi:energy-coupling factor transporter transmembrane protein EcfT/ribosomal protein L40E